MLMIKLFFKITLCYSTPTKLNYEISAVFEKINFRKIKTKNWGTNTAKL